MKLFKKLLVLLLCTGISIGCSDDDDNLPEITTMTISENMTNDGGTVYKEDNFIYEDSILTSRVTTQKYGEQQSVSHTTTFAYSGNKVTITNGAGHVFTYTLGSDGYATQCTYQMPEQVRTYQFTYSNGYLTQVDEAINSAPFMSNKLVYRDGDLVSILFGEDNEMTCHTSETLNSSHLPFMKLEDFHPLSMHMDAMYARILGKCTRHMTDSYEPVKKGSSAESPESEKTNYAYTIDSQQKVTGIHGETVYVGYVYDTQGKAHLTKSSTSRELTISYN